jgi:hypothetical protein
MTKESHDNFLHGERYIKSPELVSSFVQTLPIPINFPCWLCWPIMAAATMKM